ncbi:MAG: DUF1992 domain-containing protein [Thermodesulfobacteria bacterium]|nr:DUF1992 domain-containing protein [Thermodesulfobacteriota bacterium]
MFTFHLIAEKRIQEAMQKGQFDNLPGKGKPLVFEDDSMVPEDLRMAYKILKNAGFIPPELQTEKEIKQAVDLLETLDDEKLRYRQVTKLNVLITKMNMMRKRPVNLEANQYYYRKIVERVKVRKK